MNYSPQQRQSGAPRLNADEAIAHLRFVDAVGFHQLSAIHPISGHIHTETFGPIAESRHAIRKFISHYGPEYGLYYLANEPRRDLGPQRASKSDIIKIRTVWIDLDPKKGADLELERQRLYEVVNAIDDEPNHYPSAIVDSGGGLQVLWRLSEKLPAAEVLVEAENQTRGLIAAFDGDTSATDINRLLRLPGTINFPNKTKQLAGRTAATQALVVAHDNGADTTLDELAKFHLPISRPKASTTSTANIKIDTDAVESAKLLGDLPEGLVRRFSELRASNKAVDRLWNGDRTAASGNDASGSGFAHALALLLRPTGQFTATDYGMLLKVWDHSSADKDKIDPRYVARAWAKANPSANEEFPAEETRDAGKQLTSIFSYTDWRDNKPNFDQQYLIDELIDLGSMVVTYGASNSGKSYVVLDQAVAIATGQKWNDRKVRRGLVVYVAAEGGRGFTQRVEAYRQQRDANDIPLTVISCPINTRSASDVRKLIDTIHDAETRFGERCVLVVLDTLARVMGPGDENSATDMSVLVAACDRIRSATGATVNLIHHTGKDKHKGARGSSALQAATDTEIEIAATAPRRGTLEVTKQRDMARAKKSRFELRPVEIGQRPDGRAVTACVVDWICLAESEFEVKLLPPQQHAFDCMKKLIVEKAEAGKPKTVTFTEWQKACGPNRPGRRSDDGSAKGDKQYLVRAAADLIEQELVAKTEAGQYVIVGAS